MHQVEKNINRNTNLDCYRGFLVLVMLLGHANLLLNPLRPTFINEGIGGLEPWTFVINGYLRTFIHGVSIAFFILSGFTYGNYLINKPSMFYIKRGIWFIFLDYTIISFGWRFKTIFSNFQFIPTQEALTALGFSILLIPLFRKLNSFSLILIGLYTSILSILNWDWISSDSIVFNILVVPIRKSQFSIIYPVLNWLGFFILGLIFARIYINSLPEFSLRKKRNRLIAIVGISILMIVVGQYIFLGQNPQIRSWIQMQLYPPGISFVGYGILWSLLAFFISKKISSYAIGKNFLIHLGQHGLIYYCIHPYIYSLIDGIFNFKKKSGSFVVAFICWLVLLICSYLISKISKSQLIK